MVLIKRADPFHLQDVENLLLSVKLPTEGVKENFSNFFIAQKDNLIIGCAGVEIYEEIGLLRSVGITPSYQKQGIGQMLVNEVEELASESGILQLFLLTDTAEQFFHRLNYKLIPRNDTDVRLKQSIEFTKLCPSAPVMVKELKTT